MKSNIISIKNSKCLSSILQEVDKVCEYNKLEKKETLIVRLLAEELTGMLPELIKNFDGEFWIKNEQKKYELHVELTASMMNKEKKQSLIELSKEKKNIAATGFMGKLRDIAENMLLYSEENDLPVMCGYENLDATVTMGLPYSYVWSLDSYSKYCQEEKDNKKWDELEKSIVANLADDVLVGVKGKNVEIIIKKELK